MSVRSKRLGSRWWIILVSVAVAVAAFGIGERKSTNAAHPAAAAAIE